MEKKLHTTKYCLSTQIYPWGTCWLISMKSNNFSSITTQVFWIWYWNKNELYLPSSPQNAIIHGFSDCSSKDFWKLPSHNSITSALTNFKACLIRSRFSLLPWYFSLYEIEVKKIYDGSFIICTCISRQNFKKNGGELHLK